VRQEAEIRTTSDEVQKPTVSPVRPALVVVNCQAGTSSKEGVDETLTRLFAERNFPVTILTITPELDLRKSIEDEINAGCKLVIAGGGDGTINAVASHVRNCSATFGVLPLGTLNHFAKDLGIPTDLEGAVDTIVNGVPKPVDAGEVNGRIFLNNSSMGLYPQLVRDREAQQERGRGKWLAFTKSLFAVMLRYRYFRVHLMIDGAEVVRKTPLVFIGNNRYKLSGFDLGTREALDNGELAIYIPHSVGRMGLIFLSLRALLGTVRKADTFDEYRATEFYIDTRSMRRWRWMSNKRKRLQNVAVDGEVVFMQKPLKYRILPKVLNVLVPRDTIDNS
jgi:diacylglycerol kinase family enzyme